MKYTEHRALITNINDPKKQGRIKVKCASLLDEELELPYWIPPRFHYVSLAKDPNGKVVGAGWFGIPAKDTWVDLLVPEESQWDEVPGEQSLQMDGGGIRWKCTTYNDVATLPEVFKKNYPMRSGYAWPTGWTLFVDMKSGDMMMGYMPDGKTPKAWINIHKDNAIEIANEDGMSITLAKDRIKVVAAGAPVEITGDNVFIGDPSATEHIPLGDALFAFLNTLSTGWGASHAHLSTGLVAPSGGGPVTGVTGAPVVPMDVPIQLDLLSGKHVVEK